MRKLGCGKCGWDSGTFVSLFITHVLGITVKNEILSIDLINSFSCRWNHVKIGDVYFKIENDDKYLTLPNLKESIQDVMVKVKENYRSKCDKRILDNQDYFIKSLKPKSLIIINKMRFSTEIVKK